MGDDLGELGIYWPAVAAALAAVGGLFKWLAAKESSEQYIQPPPQPSSSQIPPWGWVLIGVVAYLLIEEGK